MSCAIGCIRWLLFVFNFIFALFGLTVVILGAIFYSNIKDVPEKLQAESTVFILGVLIIGCIVFVIAFFGCCGAIKESHCMIVTFAVLLLTILVIQVAIAVYAFVQFNGFEKKTFDEVLQTEVKKYWSSPESKIIVDFTQTTFSCCGVDSPSDFPNPPPNSNTTYPISCCSRDEHYQPAETCKQGDKIFSTGCSERLYQFFKYAGKTIGAVALSFAGVELVGIIFALCLANSIRNSDRRAYRV